MPRYLVFFWLLLPATAQNVVSTFAGTDWIYPRGTLPVLNAPLGRVDGQAFAPNGDLLLADSANAIVVRVTPSGFATVIAGTGIRGYSGDGGAATAASLTATGVAMDRQGTLYISGARLSNGECIYRKVSPTGIISTIKVCSGEGAGPITLDPSGNVYFATTRQVKRYAADGSFVVYAGGLQSCGLTPCGAVPNNTPATAAAFNYISGIAFDPAGNLYVADQMGGRIYKVTTAGLVSTLATSIASGQMACDSAGNLYASDINGSNSVKKITPGGVVTVLAGNGTRQYSGDGGLAAAAGFQDLRSVAVDSFGALFISDNGRIRRFIPGGNITRYAGGGDSLYSGDGGQAKGAVLEYPGALATDSAGNVYISEITGRIRRVAANGVITTIAGTGLISATIARPVAMAVDASGTLFFADWNQGNFTGHIRKIGANGVITTLNLNLTVEGFGALAFDRAGNLYYADSSGNKVSRIAPNGAVTPFAGTGNFGFNGDGIPATQANLGFPQGLAADAAGNVYIASNDGRLRKVALNGIITTVATGVGPFLTIDAAGNLFAAGSLSVQKISNGVTTSYSVPSNPPGGIAVDSVGNIYVSDGQNNRVWEVLGAPPAWSIAPSALHFTATAGGIAPAAQSVTVSGLPGMAWAFGGGPSWLIVSPAQGNAPGAFAVSVNPSGLAPGTYNGTLSVVMAGATPPVLSIPVTMTLLPQPAPQLVASPTGLSFVVPQGVFTVSQILTITNLGTAAATCIATPSTLSGNWLSVSGNSFGISPGASSSLNVTVNPGALPPGSYSGMATVSAGSASLQVSVAVTLTVLSPLPSMVLSLTGLTFYATSGGAAPPPSAFSILNTGSSPFAWTATASASWLAVSSASGSAPASVQVSINATGMAAGTYQGQVTVTPVGGSAQNVSVLLNVLAAGKSLPPLVRPAGLLFTSQGGTDPASQQIVITNLGSQAASYVSGRIPESGAFFTSLPLSATVQPGQSGLVTVQPSIAGLSPGVSRGALTLLFDDGTIETAGILMVTAPAVVALDSGCTPRQLAGIVTSLTNGVRVTAGQPVTLAARIADDCGNPLAAGSVVAQFDSGDSPLVLNPLGDGNWEATWVPSAPADAVNISFTARGNSIDAAAVAQVDVQVGSNPATAAPLIFPGGVGSVAYPVSKSPVALGGLIAIYGSGLATQAQRAQTVPLPTTLGGAQVMLGSQPLPLLYAGPGQIDAVVPFDAPLNVPLPLTVTVGPLQSLAEPVIVATARPAVFLLPQIAPAQGAIVGPAGLAVPGAAAGAGDRAVIYCEGLGPVNLSSDGLSRTTNTVTVTIGGVLATVEFAGLAPGAVGEYQVNVVVPSGVSPGDAVPVVLQVAGAQSPVVTMAIR